MSIISLKTMVDQMNVMRQAGSNNNHNQLTNLTDKMNIMFQYRNDDLRDADPEKNNDNTPNEIENKCIEHYHENYTEYLKSKGLEGDELSVGDVNNTLIETSHCSCNAREQGGCYCVSRTLGNYCNCNVRNPIQCSCVARSGGKYDPVCVCNVRYTGCDCVSRVTSSGCQCHTRCSCNAVNEYTMTPVAEMDKTCLCQNRMFDHGCQCYTRTISAVEPCECQYRGSSCTANETAPGDWADFCTEHQNPSASGACTCNSRSAISDRDYCVCYSRTGAIMCQCDMRGGAVPVNENPER